jgi:hypothetical protein
MVCKKKNLKSQDFGNSFSQGSQAPCERLLMVWGKKILKSLRPSISVLSSARHLFFTQHISNTLVTHWQLSRERECSWTAWTALRNFAFLKKKQRECPWSAWTALRNYFV